MNSLERRNKILEILSQRDSPISGSKLAEMVKVSRQVIVQDIALLRAAGSNIIATPQGYFMILKDEENVRKTIVSKHDKSDIRDELTTIVDEGGTVVDVIVEHSIYGQICGNIMVRSRRDVDNFMEKINQKGTKPLSNLTDGIHLHTIECKDEETMSRIENALRKKGYLVE